MNFGENPYHSWSQCQIILNKFMNNNNNIKHQIVHIYKEYCIMFVIFQSDM